MKFSGKGLLISQKKYGESSAIIKIFSAEHGIYSGFVKSARNRALLQVGNLITFEFHNRVEENLGQFYRLDLVKSYCSPIIFNQLRLNCVSSILALVDNHFPERENYSDIFTQIQDFLQKALGEATNCELLADYVRLELEILKSLGYGLDLSSCAVTETTEDLRFVSPKSARAVSFEAGKAYEAKLLKLPKFLIEENAILENDCLDKGIKLSGFFLKKFLDHSSNLYRDNILRSLSQS